ncbi:MFS transporter [Actinoplanes sp. NPDC051494]|uniref:MFS transporter n=1 Tax=Actinoplanes sp. NPDC051494 TaxID=3363907 RepID=UPI00379912F5
MSFTSDGSCWRDVRIAAAARGISVCGDLLAATALALALQQAGAGGLVVSALMLAAVAPIALLAPVAGRIADRADSRTVLVLAGVAQAAICAVLAFVSSPALIIALVAVLACGLAITQPTLAALLPSMVRREDMARAGGITQTATNIGALIAPALAGVLVGQLGPRVPLLIDALSYLSLVAAGLLLRTRRRSVAPATVLVRWRLRDDKLVTAMVVAVAGTVAGVGAINVIEVFFVRETLHSSTTMFGLISATWVAGALAGAQLFGRLGRRWTDPARLVRIILLLAAGCCVAVLAASGVPNALVMVPLWFAGGVCNGGLNVFSGVVVAERVPVAARGRAFAAMGSIVQVGGMAGFLAGGPLLELFAPRPLVAAAGIAGLIAVAASITPVFRADSSQREKGPSQAAEPGVSQPLGDSVGA